jgi:hypothetical protein
MKRSWLRIGLGVVALVGAAFAVFAVLPAPEPELRDVDYAAYAGGPRESLRVFWVGHSLLNAVDPHVPGSQNVLDRVGQFAESRDHAYTAFDDTLFGASLSLLWNGQPHSYDREEPEASIRLQELLQHGDQYDALVMTEGVPILMSMKREHSAYYAQRFYCAMVTANPEASVYLYETWSHLQAGDPDADYGPREQWDWVPRLEDDRNQWTHIADLAMTGRVGEPRLRRRLAALFGGTEPGCTPRGPIFLVPVARVMVELANALEASPMPGPEGSLAMTDLFLNPYIDWPADWPLDYALSRSEREEILARLTLRRPGEEPDDIHPSELGVWLTSVVHYATLYRETPVGLPGPAGLPAETVTAIQELVWRVVRADPRTGVAG